MGSHTHVFAVRVVSSATRLSLGGFARRRVYVRGKSQWPLPCCPLLCWRSFPACNDRAKRRGNHEMLRGYVVSVAPRVTGLSVPLKALSGVRKENPRDTYVKHAVPFHLVRYRRRNDREMPLKPVHGRHKPLQQVSGAVREGRLARGGEPGSREDPSAG